MRDRRLDFWRGLCMVDMVLVHLVWEGVQVGPLFAAVIEYTRFAAGGFVFVAGAAIGHVFLPRARGATRWRTYVELWQRAAYVLGVHYAAAASFIALGVWRGWPSPTEPLAATWALLTLRAAPPYGDILPLYVTLLAISPALLELARRGLLPAVAVASAGLFLVGQRHPWALSPRAPELFPVILWQAMFVAGLVFAAWLPRLERSSRHLRIAAAGGALIAWTALTVAARNDGLLPGIPIALTFRKVPLTGPEFLRYLTATLVVLLGSGPLWHRLENRTATRLIETIGRRSLAAYVAHVWILAGVIAVAARIGEMGRAQVALAPVALFAVLAVARGLEWWRLATAAGWRLGAALRAGGALPAGAAAAAALVVALHIASVPVEGDDLPSVSQGGPEVVADTDAGDEIELIDPYPSPTEGADEHPAGDEEEAMFPSVVRAA